MARNPNAWLIPSEIEPAFDGGIIQNQFIKGTLFILQTNAQKLALKKLYRVYDGEASTMCYVVSENGLYVLNNDAQGDSTIESDWTPIPLGSDNAIAPVGEWSASTGQVVGTGQVLQDTDAVGNNGEFYIVTDAPSGVTNTYPGLFRDLQVTVFDGDYVLSVGNYFTALRPTVTWDTLDKPQVIDDYVAGSVIYHTHLAADITDLPALLALKLDVAQVASIVENNLNNITDDEIVSVGFLRKWIYFKDETYSQAEVDALIQLGAQSFPFDGNRPITKIPEAGEILGTSTIDDWQEEAYYGKVKPKVLLDSINTLEIGSTTAPTFNAQIQLNQYDFIVSAEFFTQGGVSVGSPPFVPTDPINYITYQSITPIPITETSTDSFYLRVVFDSGGVQSTIDSELLAITPVYPILFGSDVSGLSATDLYLNLTKLIEADGNKELTYNSDTNRMYYCMPEEYADRVSILDNAGSDILGSLFPNPPVILPVTSTGLTADWTHNYKVYEANYDTDSSDVLLEFVLQQGEALGTDTTLDDIQEGVVNKHLTEPLKQKLVSFNGDDYLSKAAYDANDDGIVALSGAVAFTGENLTGNIITAGTAVLYQGVDLVGATAEIILADKDSDLPCYAVTREDIPNGGFGVCVSEGAIAPLDTTGTIFAQTAYLGNGGNIVFTRPTSGFVQPVGRVIVENNVSGAILVSPSPASDLYSSVEPWETFRTYTTNTILSVLTGDLPNRDPNGSVIVRVVDTYTSSSSPATDITNGDLEILGGDMKQEQYDPNSVEKDVFDMDSMQDGLTETDPAIRKVTLTENQRIKLDGLQPSTFKGTFPDPTALRTAFPTSQDGDSANVTSTGTVWVWNSLLPPSVTPPTTGGDWEDSLASSGGDMLASTYDPTGQATDAFNIQNTVDPSAAPTPVGVDARVFLAAEKTKLGGIEDNATADQTAGEIKTAYESNADTNAYTDAEKTKLGGIENNATADQTGAEIKVAYEGEPDTNAFNDAAETKLAGIEDGAEVNPADTDELAEGSVNLYWKEAPNDGSYNVRRNLAWEADSPPSEFSSVVLASPISTTSDVPQLALSLTFTPNVDPSDFEYVLNFVWQSNDDNKLVEFEIRVDTVVVQAYTVVPIKKDYARFALWIDDLPALDNTAHTIELYYANILGENRIITIEQARIAVNRTA